MITQHAAAPEAGAAPHPQGAAAMYAGGGLGEDAETAGSVLGAIGRALGELFGALAEVIPVPVLLLAGLGIVVAVLMMSTWGRTEFARFASGRPMDGVARTNATTFRYGTKSVDDFADSRATRWELRPYAQRAFIRWSVLAAVVTFLVCAVVVPWLTLAVVVAAVVGALLWRTRATWTPTAKTWARAGGRRTADVALGRVPVRKALSAGPSTAVAVADGDGDGDGALAETGTGEDGSAGPGEPDPGEEGDEAPWSLKTPRDMVREILDPLWDGVRPAIGLSLGMGHKARDFIVLPRSVDEDDAVVRVRLPREWQGWPDERSALDYAVTSRLPGEWAASYQLKGAHHSVSYRRVPRPPKSVSIDQCWHLIEKMKPHAPVFAVGPRGVPVTADLIAESPHIAVSMGSGAGKSTLVRALIAILAHLGAEIHILDVKRTSHRWAKGLPNVRIYKEVHEIHDALVELGERAEQRHREEDENPDVEFHRLVVVAEEMNILADKLEDYWETLKATDESINKKLKSPAFKGMAAISFGGRSARVHLIGIAQKLDARLFGSRSGGAARENFALRLMARFQKPTWKQLADIYPMPKLAEYLGRIAVVSGGKWTEAQVIYWPDEVARAYAVSGVVTPVSHPSVTAEVVVPDTPVTGDESHGDTCDSHSGPAAPPSGPSAAGGGRSRVLRTGLITGKALENDAGRGPAAIGPAPVDAPEETAGMAAENRVLVTFKEAYDRGMFAGVSYDNARKIYSRESKKGMAPGPVQDSPKKWDLDELAEWWTDRMEEKRDA